MKTVTVSEAALDSLKAMGQRDKERIEELERAVFSMWQLLTHAAPPIREIRQIAADVMVNPYSNSVIQKAE